VHFCSQAERQQAHYPTTCLYRTHFTCQPTSHTLRPALEDNEQYTPCAITHKHATPQKPPTSGVRCAPSPLAPAPASLPVPEPSLLLVAASLDPGRGTGRVSMLYSPFVVLGNRCARVCENTTAHHTASVGNSTFATRCNSQDTMQHYVPGIEHKRAQLMPHVWYSNQRTPNISL
jgi:hypothetical protein